MACTQPWCAQVNTLKEDGVSMIRFVTPDLLGRLRGKAVGMECAESMLTNGLGIFMGCFVEGCDYELPAIPEFETKGFCSVYLKPATDIIYKVPWSKANVAQVMCDVFWKDGAPLLQSPRAVLTRQLSRLSAMGLTMMSAFESEFNIYKSETGTLSPITDLPMESSITALAEFEDLFCEITDKVKAAGIHVEHCEHEYSPGQFEITFKPTWGVETVDNFVVFKDAVRSICKQRKLTASFMTRPFDHTGFSNATHFNLSIWKHTGDPNQLTNIFYEQSRSNLTDFGRHWIGGILNHMDALTALCCPTINCYRRLHYAGAPGKKDWDMDNRLCSWRVVVDESCRMENRLVSGSADPYVVVAATIAAGLDGVEQKTEPPVHGVNPQSEDIPHTLQEAIEKLKSDQVMLKALGEEYIDWWLRVKDMEIKHMGGHYVKHDRELKLKLLKRLSEVETERKFYFNL